MPAPKAETRVRAIDIVVETSLKATTLCETETRSAEAKFAVEIASRSPIGPRGESGIGEDVELVRRGKEVAVLVSPARYARMAGERTAFGDAYDAFMRGRDPKVFGLDAEEFDQVAGPGSCFWAQWLECRAFALPLRVQLAWIHATEEIS